MLTQFRHLTRFQDIVLPKEAKSDKKVFSPSYVVLETLELCCESGQLKAGECCRVSRQRAVVQGSHSVYIQSMASFNATTLKTTSSSDDNKNNKPPEYRAITPKTTIAPKEDNTAVKQLLSDKIKRKSSDKDYFTQDTHHKMFLFPTLNPKTPTNQTMFNRETQAKTPTNQTMFNRVTQVRKPTNQTTFNQATQANTFLTSSSTAPLTPSVVPNTANILMQPRIPLLYQNSFVIPVSQNQPLKHNMFQPGQTFITKRFAIPNNLMQPQHRCAPQPPQQLPQETTNSMQLNTRDRYFHLNVDGKSVFIPCHTINTNPTAFIVDGPQGNTDQVNAALMQKVDNFLTHTNATNSTHNMTTHLQQPMGNITPNIHPDKVLKSPDPNPPITVKKEPIKPGYDDKDAPRDNCEPKVKQERLDRGYSDEPNISKNQSRSLKRTVDQSDKTKDIAKIPKLDEMKDATTKAERINLLKKRLQEQEKELEDMKQRQALEEPLDIDLDF